MRAVNGERDPLERPWNRRALQCDLAYTDTDQRTLAAKYGVTQPAVSAFKIRHQAQIDFLRMEEQNKLAGLALAEQANRIETYQEMLDLVIDKDPKLAARILRSIAEELGQLPSRSVVITQNITPTKYTVEGVDPEDLT